MPIELPPERYRLVILAAQWERAQPLADVLLAEGFDIRLLAPMAADGSLEGPDAILLVPPDVAPSLGATMVRRLRDSSTAPCILVAAPHATPEDRIAALEAGADEVLPPGIPAIEAIARLRALLRRVAPSMLDQAATAWSLLVQARALSTPGSGEVVRLTTAEYGLLHMLAAAGTDPVERDAICQQVFRRPWRPDDRAVDSLVKRVRRKLPADTIHSVRGVGYALAVTLRIQP